ncbi:NACHT domain-containing protein, partial [bacterium]
MQQQGRNNEFIQLNRLFKKIELGDKDTDNPFEFDYDSILGNKTDKNIYWKNVIANDIAIVLGEAGSGKTLELKEQCKSLKRNGEHAFFLRLEQLNKTIDEDLLVNIEEWKKTKSKGYFFLDSVDESKLKDVKDFESALTNFKNLIGKQSLANSKIIITSRISEFRYKQDAELIKSLFNQYGEITIYQIEPLDKDRIIQFANKYDSFSASGFIEEVKTKYLWNLLTRPLDLIDLLNYWLQNKSFGTYKEIIEYNISNKLVDPDSNRQKSLTLEGKKIRNAVERLAACVLLTGESIFLINENHSLELEALNPKEILNQEWSATEISQLLQLPVFDDAIYGKVRFHHRKKTEYLAACWFNNLLNSNLSLSSIEHYFWGEINGNLFLNDRLKPVIAWLCVGENPWNNKIREIVLSNYPELFLEHGDPSSLDIQDQVTIIKSLSRKYGQTNYYDYFENEALAKFGNPKIGEIINELLFDDLSEEFKLLLIRIAFFANLKTCIPAIFLLLKRTESVSIINFGVEFIGTLGDESSVQELIQYLKTIELKNTTIAAAVRTFFPNKISIADFIWFISRVSDPVDRFDKVEYDLNQAFHEHLNKLDTLTIEALLIGLSDLLLSPPFHREYRPISKKYSWLGQSFELLVNRYLKETPKKNDVILVKSLFICVYLELWGFSRQNIVRNVHLNQEQREKLFDEAYKVLGSKLHYYQLFNNHIIQVALDIDSRWLLNRIKVEKDRFKQKIMIDFVLNLNVHPVIKLFNKLKILN